MIKFFQRVIEKLLMGSSSFYAFENTWRSSRMLYFRGYEQLQGALQKVTIALLLAKHIDYE